LGSTAHARTPEIVANLQAGFELYLDFSVACGAVDDAKRERLANRCWEALRDAAAAQAKHQAASEPTARFLALLRSLLASGRAHLQARNGGTPDRAPGSCGWRRDNAGTWSSRGDCVGWTDGDDIYLEPTASYGAVQIAGRDANEMLAVTAQTLKKRLREKGLLASVDEKRETLTVRRSIGGHVGFAVGKLGLPDMPRFKGINGLSAKCRECQVFIGGESAGEIALTRLAFRSKMQNPVKLFWIWDLHDARHRR
jgi:hypothetical protein